MKVVPRWVLRHRIRREETLMWLLLQSLIVFAVVGSTIHWHWTPNIYLQSLMGFGLAFVVTAGVNELRARLRR